MTKELLAMAKEMFKQGNCNFQGFWHSMDKCPHCRLRILIAKAEGK